VISTPALVVLATTPPATSPLATDWPGATITAVLLVASLALAVVLAVLAFLDRTTPVWALALVGLLEVGLLVLAVVGIVAWVGGTGPAEPVVFAFYLVACLVVPPLMVWWGRGEPGRWGSGVVAIACLVLAVLILRVAQVWTGAVGGVGA
jgi:hypothetical protein